jgi:hypothetical protein
MVNRENLSKKEVKKEVDLAVHKKLLTKAETFRSEFKKQTAAAIITAFGLIIALAWKDVITDLISKLNFAQGILLSAVIVTVFSVLGILIVSHWAKADEKSEEK